MACRAKKIELRISIWMMSNGITVVVVEATKGNF